MPAYVIFDVEIRDMNQYQEFMKGVKPAVEEAGGKYLARGGQRLGSNVRRHHPGIRDRIRRVR
jgi:uncharacterized protein (DUF1330 family)